MFIAAPFTTAKRWKWPKCPPTDECTNKMWYIHTMEYYSAIKKNEIMPFATTWMDLEIFILSELNQTKTNIIWYHLYAESKKMIQMNLFTKQKQTHRLRRQTYGYQRGKVAWGINWEFGINRCKLLHTEWISNKVLLCSTGNYIQYPEINHNGKENKKECTYVYNWFILLYSRN